VNDCNGEGCERCGRCQFLHNIRLGDRKISIESFHCSRLPGRKSNLPNRRRECMQLRIHIDTILKMAAHSSEVKDARNDVRLRSGVLN
jgi:uncharacterized cysteine cluster protein YcgN (CxxCxxCC family)